MTPRCCLVNPADAYTRMFPHGRILVRLSRQVGFRVGWVRDAYKKPSLDCVPIVRFIDSAGQIHLVETGLALIPGVDEYEIVG